MDASSRSLLGELPEDGEPDAHRGGPSSMATPKSSLFPIDTVSKSPVRSFPFKECSPLQAIVRRSTHRPRRCAAFLARGSRPRTSEGNRRPGERVRGSEERVTMKRLLNEASAFREE